MGDIHGNYKGLVQCLERSGFNYKEDTLIQLGDIADGWSEVPECVEELMKIKNLITIKGNHDDWCYQWMQYRVKNMMWLTQGGQATYDAYTVRHPDKLAVHEVFFRKQHNYYVDDANRVFVHGGYKSDQGIGHDPGTEYFWNRDLWLTALSGDGLMRSKKSLDKRLPRLLRPHREIFIGHTTTVNWGKDVPMKACNVWNLDTGSGFKGKLTIMDVDTKEYWQSDLVQELYPKEKGR